MKAVVPALTNCNAGRFAVYVMVAALTNANRPRMEQSAHVKRDSSLKRLVFYVNFFVVSTLVMYIVYIHSQLVNRDFIQVPLSNQVQARLKT